MVVIFRDKTEGGAIEQLLRVLASSTDMASRNLNLVIFRCHDSQNASWAIGFVSLIKLKI